MHQLALLLYKIFSADQNIVSNSGRLHHLPSLSSKKKSEWPRYLFKQRQSECTNHCPYFQKFQVAGALFHAPLIKSQHVLIFSLQFQISFLKNVIMHRITSLFQSDLCGLKLFQILSESTIYRHCFPYLLCSFNQFSKCSLHFQIVSNAVRMYHLLSLFSKLFSYCSCKYC